MKLGCIQIFPSTGTTADTRSVCYRVIMHLTESELCCRLKAMIDDLTKLRQRQSDFGHWSISRPEHNDADSSGARKRCASAPVVDKLRGNWIPLFLKSRKSYYNNSLLKLRSEKCTVGIGRCSHAAVICKRLS